MTPLELALAILGEFGFPVFPCAENKRPTCPNGFKDASKDPDGVHNLWSRYPGPLVGVPTGIGTGIDILDVDPRHHGDGWLATVRLPATRTHKTRSGGRHFFFACDDRLRNSQSKIATGVDTRCTGGYIIWWPAHGLPVEHKDCLAPWPGWLINRLLPPPPPKPRPVVAAQIITADRYARAAVDSGCARIRNAQEGCRNATLNSEAFALARFVQMGAIGSGELAEALGRAAGAAGLHPREVGATVASAFKARRLG